jgi:dTDP-4-dehydrorhamnose reductase
MRIVVIGAAGQLGSELMSAFAEHRPIGVDHKLFDIEVPAAMAKMLLAYRPELVINTAAFHNVELCETHPERAFAVNALAVDGLAAQCAAYGETLVHISTDYVFDGSKSTPYAETDAPNPISAYGISKYAGELLVRRHTSQAYVVRTSGLYGVRGSSTKGYTFIDRILTQAAEGKPLRVVTDVTFSPSYAGHVASAIRDIVATKRYGTYHVTNTGHCTWYEFAMEALRQAGYDIAIEPTLSANFPSIARRPAFSALANTALIEAGIRITPSWQDGIMDYLKQKNP